AFHRGRRYGRLRSPNARPEGAEAVANRIVCTELKYPTEHRHIVAVGIGTDPNKASNRWTVEQVRSALLKGTRFYTQSLSTGKIANVERFDCSCGYKTIRST